MEVHAVCDSSHVYVAHFGSIAVLPAFTLHPAFLVNNTAFNDTVSDSFSYDVLGILLGVEVEFETDVTQGDT